MDAGATGTRPHPDVSDLVFSGSTSLRATDGGIYRHLNPLGPGTKWQSAIGNLRDTEIYSVALNNRSNTNTADDDILIGTQDNGSVKLTPDGQWTTVQGGDGTEVQVFDGGFAAFEYTTT